MSRNVEYIITLKDKFTKNLKGADKAVKNMNRSTSMLNSTIKKATGLLGAFSAVSTIKSVIDLGVEMEQTRVAFATFLKDGTKANKLISQLNEFANITPFNNKEVIKSGRVLLAANIPAEQIQSTLKNIGDVAAGANVPLTEMAAIYAKSMNKGRLQAEELNQLAERGVPILQVLGEMFGKTSAEVMKMGSEGKITSDILAKSFKLMTSEGGIFYNLMAKQSATLGGKLSTIQGKFQLLGASIGENNGVLKGYADTAIKLADYLLKNQNVIERLIKTVISAAKYFVIYKVAVFATGKAMQLARAASIAYRIATVAMNRGIKSAIVLTKGFNTALKSNVIGLAITGLAILITKLSEYKSKAQKAREEQERLNQEIMNSAYNLRVNDINKFLNKAGVFDIRDTTDSIIERVRKQIDNSDLELLEGVSQSIATHIEELQRKFDKMPTSIRSRELMILRKSLKVVNDELIKYKRLNPAGVDVNTTTNKQKVTQITSSAPKVINININKLIESQVIKTENLKESTPKIKQMIIEALMEATNDFQLNFKAG